MKDINYSELVKKLDKRKQRLFKKIEKTENKEDLKLLVKKVEDVDFEIQEAMGFEKSKKFHKWYETPKCICPKSDNRECLGTDYRIIAQDCPLHGGDL